MKQPTALLRMRHDRGLTLIELMVSMVIGLILMIAVVATYLGASGAGRVSEAQGRMNEDAQAALSILAQQLRMAGNNPKQPNYTAAAARNPVYGAVYAGSPGTYFVRGCDGTFSNIAAAADIPTLVCDAGGGAAPDSIAISYEADIFNTIPTTTTPIRPTDCLGQSLTLLGLGSLVFNPDVNQWNGTSVVPLKAQPFAVADNRFYLANSAVTATPSLYCKGSGNAIPQPLVENVEDLQFVYGTADSAAATLAVAGYINADGMLTGALGALADDLRWSKVMTVRICVVVRSVLPVVPDAASAQYVRCDGTVNAAPGDLRLRRAYSTTVVLRNRVPS
jgi:type IV pilus assembly protein PilW